MHFDFLSYIIYYRSTPPNTPSSNAILNGNNHMTIVLWIVQYFNEYPSTLKAVIDLGAKDFVPRLSFTVGGSYTVWFKSNYVVQANRVAPTSPRRYPDYVVWLSSLPAHRCPQHSLPLLLPLFLPVNYTARLFMDTSDMSKLSKSLRELRLKGYCKGILSL
jgi:hypothetical protein